jgi:hypothetical protein
MPNFEMPKMEIPAEFREFADNSASQVRETFERMRSAAEASTDVIEEEMITAVILPLTAGQGRTWFSTIVMSALCQKRTSTFR